MISKGGIVCERSFDRSSPIDAPAFNVGIMTEILMKVYCITGV
jgi:hypothetical protein